MGFLGFGKPKAKVVVVDSRKKKGGRPTKEEAAERRKQKLAEAELELKLMEKQQELERRRRKFAGESELLSIEVKDLKALNEQLGSIGMEIVYKGTGHPIGGGDILQSLLRELVPAVPGIVKAFAQAPTPAGPPSQGWKPSPEPVISTPPALPPAAPEAIPAEPPSSMPPANTPPESPSLDGQDVSARLIAGFTDQPPEALAAFLLNQDSADIQRLVGFLRMSDDNGARNILETVAGDNAELAPFIAWLLEPQRSEWFSAALIALKKG